RRVLAQLRAPLLDLEDAPPARRLSQPAQLRDSRRVEETRNRDSLPSAGSPHPIGGGAGIALDLPRRLGSCTPRESRLRARRGRRARERSTPREGRSRPTRGRRGHRRPRRESQEITGERGRPRIGTPIRSRILSVNGKRKTENRIAGGLLSFTVY